MPGEGKKILRVLWKPGFGQTSNGKGIRKLARPGQKWMDRADYFAEENKPNKKQVSEFKETWRKH